MGGDGGVIASNRRYLRGAGKADHTADAASSKNNEQESAVERMRTCHLTKAPLNFSSPKQIVACPYGRLYSKEAAVEALLRRTQQQQEKGDELGSHIRGLKDLIPVRFHMEGEKPTCPVTGVELNGKHPAFLIPKSKGLNVLSERALKEMGMEALQADYGPFEKSDMIRLAPPESIMEEIKEAVAKKQELEKANKKSKKQGKKRKKHDAKSTSPQKSKTQKTVADAARERVASAVASNDVLSSLFTSSQKGTDKERADRLFTVGTS